MQEHGVYPLIERKALLGFELRVLSQPHDDAQVYQTYVFNIKYEMPGGAILQPGIRFEVRNANGESDTGPAQPLDANNFVQQVLRKCSDAANLPGTRVLTG